MSWIYQNTSIESIKILHLESTDVCQAACPLCARETDPRFNKKIHHYFTLDSFQRAVPEKLIYKLDKFFMCGNYGDPAANDASTTIFSYVKSINSNIVLGMNTNGGLQNSHWWTNLANILNKPTDYVVFSIDGLEDTNHIYRKNVSWDRVMRNAEAFIKAGGNAQWDMLVYEHNEHQVDDCEQLAKSMEFKWFRTKVSKRPSNINWLNPPKGWTNPVIVSDNIECSILKENSVYLSANGYYFPCCWQANDGYNLDQFDQLKNTWTSDSPNSICKRICGTKDSKNSFTNQWQRITQF
jgi:sulfatase maturation enzyme AslB (radical SAM superfamily)